MGKNTIRLAYDMGVAILVVAVVGFTLAAGLRLIRRGAGTEPFAIETPLDLMHCAEAGAHAMLVIPAESLLRDDTLGPALEGWACYPAGVR